MACPLLFKMRQSLAVVLCGWLGVALIGAAATSKKKSSGAKTNASKKSAGTKSASKKSASKKTASAKKKSSKKGRTATTWRNRQLHPTPERYLEIQRALASKGYLNGEPSGVWDDASVEALRTFQREQNLEPSGKLDSLSLIALGLGPKHETPAKSASPPQP
jgi:peptidoglycan hydrolase-like protein with peptidoglycan-binding domain